MDEEITAKTYVDLLIAEEQFEKNADSLKARRKEIFKKYETNEKKYLYSFDTFAEDEERWKSFNEYAQTYLDTLKKKHGIK
ncbi:MAG: hypothetical protein V1720_10030 [bacterium]